MDTGVFSGANSGLFGTDNYVSRFAPRAGVTSFLDAITTADEEQVDRNSDRKIEVRELSDRRTSKTLLDKKSLNHSEERSSDMLSEYDKRTAKSERRVIPTEKVPANTFDVAAKQVVQMPIPTAAEMVLAHTFDIAAKPVMQMQIPAVTETVSANTASVAANLPMAQVMPLTMTPLTGARATTSTTAAASAVTIFTVSQHLTSSANSPHKSTEEDSEHSGGDSGNEEDNKERKRKKKKTPFAAITALLPRTEQPPVTYKRNGGIRERHSGGEPTLMNHAASTVIHGGISAVASDADADAMLAILDSSPEVTVAEQEHKQFLQRIAAACEAAVQHSAPIRMKVNLDQLGTLLIELKQNVNKISLHFSTPSKAAARLIADNLAELKKMLAERGLVGKIEIDASASAADG